MNAIGQLTVVCLALLETLAIAQTAAYGADRLPSWKDGKAKQSNVDFVAKVT